ncbi:MFS transporter [Streptomyces sp. NBC_01233]|uniref:MFS transporter n=1 Tax=Streptomyces sp. NBC_01233 TaxID=2903787 RepID=UPI002E0D6D1E|nr:MFS transporter [Streptomyces sp. NBC_01233]
MAERQSLGSGFRWLWASYAASTLGTWLAFDAFPLIAILLLHAEPAEVSVLAAAGLAVGAVVAVPLAPWVEFRRKRPVMIAMDLVRFTALMTVPIAFMFDLLSYVQLMVVSVVVAAANITFRAASGACLKALVPRESLLIANGRFESTTWTATVLGPPLGGAAIGLLGPVVTVMANAVSFLLSAVGIRAIGGTEQRPESAGTPGLRAIELFEGWRYILTHPALRPLLFNTILVNGLIMATSPLLAVLMLGPLGFAPWQYGLAFGLPCIGGIIGSRVARPLVRSFGEHQVMLTAGVLRACWLLGLVFIQPGVAGIVVVVAVEFGMITCMGVFNPVFATYRLEQTATDRVARVLSAWTVTSNATVAMLTVLWGVLASLIGPRTAIGIAGVLMLTTPLLLLRSRHTTQHERVPAMISV